MRNRAGVLARLERLEQRQKQFARPRVIIRLFQEEEAGEIIGFNVGNAQVAREAGETVGHCAARAFEHSPGVCFIAAVYADWPRTHQAG